MKTCTKCDEAKELTAFGARKTSRDGLYPWCRACCVVSTRAHQSGPEWRAKKAEYDRERVARLKPVLAEQASVRYERNRSDKLAAAKRWANENRDARRVISMNYKSRRRAQEEGGISTSELKAWINLQDKRCLWCSADCADAFHVDHVEPLSRGGKHEASNLAISCPTCNLRKQAMPPERWIEKLRAA